jgi:OmpA-OmpF porin, OOP family
VSGLAALVAMSAAEAYADDCAPLGSESNGRFSRCVDVDNLWFRPGDSKFFSIGAARTTPAGEVSFGAAASYSSRPLVLQSGGPDPEGRDTFVVDNLFDTTFLFALGATDRLELTVAAPVTFYQDGDGYGSLLGLEGALSRSAVRDARFGLALAILERERKAAADGFALLGRFEFTAPFGQGEAFAGGRTGAAIPAVTLDYKIDRFSAAAEVGARIRGEAELGQATWGTQVSTALGAHVDIWEPLGIGMGAEAFSLVTVAEQGEDQPLLVPAEWMATARIAPVLAGDLSLSIGGGGPIPFTESGATAPRFRFSFVVSYAPQGLDSDGDGVPDRDDGCVDVAEDRDAFEDADGCPEPDNDKDRIPDDRDRCRDAAETMDGFRDDDGCPDNDDDADGVADENDKCRNQKEDKDRFQDDDGCPDLDNDQDGLLDAADTCPTGAEDKDGFRDEDGCPDPDNDADQVPDATDSCPDAREDKDGFDDTDGCPDPDNDGDGVLDAADKCPTDAETLDGNADDDGCPEPGAKSLVAVERDGHVSFTTPARFAAGKSTISPELERQLRVLARLVLGRADRGIVIVEAYPDKSGDKSAAGAKLASARADSVRATLIAAGLPGERVTAASGDPAAARKPNDPHIDVSVTAPSSP